ncbi:MAG TPA: succinylglutamate desuccinylase/aspartoacylase family protein [Verrucomicrobiae bacterium]|nr:succinylglutamate desuccinylase/aspartoacylase family protein [Verrucomicrobiae bacterium]
MADILAPLDALAARLPAFIASPLPLNGCDDEGAVLPRYLFLGEPGGAASIHIGLFGGLHGDEPASAFGLVRFAEHLERKPEIARGYYLSIYPVCNLAGFVAGTRHAASGKDLNREFWRGSTEPEVRLLERELTDNRFDGLIALHTDDTSDGLYGFTSGALFTEELLRPALQAAETILPVNQHPVIDGFDARQGICRQGYSGVLSAPPLLRPRPFEIVFETPQHAPPDLQERAFVVALETMLREYRRFIAYAANL